MTSDSLLQQFDVIANAPNGVQKLRELVLELAVRGKLVAQDPSDEPAAVLLERLGVGKARPLEKGRQAKPKQLRPISENETHFELPSGWEWTRLETLGTVNPRNELPDAVTAAFCPMSSLPEAYGGTVNHESRPWREIKKGYTHFAENDVVVAKITPCFQNGKAAVMRNLPGGAGAGTTELHVFRPVGGTVVPDYVLMFLKTPGFVSGGVKTMTGTAGQQRVSSAYFAQTPFPLPPLAEQRRITAKVDELMAVCDALEAQQQRRTEARIRLNRSALYQLTTASDDAEFAAHWQRLRENFRVLYDTPETVADLRQAVLQLAVHGKLTLQDPNDEPASVLLDRIATDRRSRFDIRTSSELTQPRRIGKHETPFQLPDGWDWARFPEVGELARGKSKHRPRNDPTLYTNGSYPLVQTGDISRGKPFVTTHTGKYNETGLLQSRLWPANTLCISIAANIAESALLGFDACFPDSVVGFIPDTGLADTKYFLYFMRTAKEHLAEFAPATAQKNINLAILEDLLIPLPPLLEQHRIVAKVDELMAYCDTLELHLTRAREKSARLAAGAVHNLTAA